MALIDEEFATCAFCNELLVNRPYLAFTKINPNHPLLGLIDDSAVHCDCLDHFPKRDELISVWNEQWRGCPVWLLEISRDGHVRYLTRWGRILYRLGVKRIGPSDARNV